MGETELHLHIPLDEREDLNDGAIRGVVRQRRFRGTSVDIAVLKLQGCRYHFTVSRLLGAANCRTVHHAIARIRLRRLYSFRTW